MKPAEIEEKFPKVSYSAFVNGIFLHRKENMCSCLFGVAKQKSPASNSRWGNYRFLDTSFYCILPLGPNPSKLRKKDHTYVGADCADVSAAHSY